MKRAKFVLAAVAALAIVGTVFAFKANRSLILFYSLNTTTTDPAAKLCTVPTFIRYTTNEADKLPNAPTIVQTTYYSTAVLATACPQLTIWAHQ